MKRVFAALIVVSLLFAVSRVSYVLGARNGRIGPVDPDPAKIEKRSVVGSGAESVGRAEPLETKGAAKDTVSIPAGAIRYFSCRAFLGFRGTFDPAFARDLGLSVDQVEGIEKIADETLGALAGLEAANAMKRTDAGGGEFYFIPPLGEQGLALKQTMGSKIERIVGPGVRDLLMNGTDFSRNTFAGFGERGREVSVREMDIEGDAPTYIFEQTFLREDGSRSGSKGQRLHNTADFQARYGSLFKPD